MMTLHDRRPGRQGVFVLCSGQPGDQCHRHALDVVVVVDLAELGQHRVDGVGFLR